MTGTCFKRAAISRCNKVYPGKLLLLGIQNVVQTLQNNRLWNDNVWWPVRSRFIITSGNTQTFLRAIYFLVQWKWQRAITSVFYWWIQVSRDQRGLEYCGRLYNLFDRLSQWTHLYDDIIKTMKSLTTRCTNLDSFTRRISVASNAIQTIR